MNLSNKLSSEVKNHNLNFLALINSEVYFDKFLGIIEKSYSDRKNRKENRKLKEEISEYEGIKKNSVELREINVKLYKENEKLEEKLKNSEKPKNKHKTLPFFQRPHKYNWSNIKFLISVDFKTIAYELNIRKVKFDITPRMKKIFIKICSAPEANNIDYNKNERSDLNVYLKQTFNINEEALEWISNQKVYKLHFKNKFLKDKQNLKIITESESISGFEFTQDEQGNQRVQSKKYNNEYDGDISGYEDFYSDE